VASTLNQGACRVSPRRGGLLGQGARAKGRGGNGTFEEWGEGAWKKQKGWSRGRSIRGQGEN